MNQSILSPQQRRALWPQLMAILSARWRSADGKYNVGIEKEQLHEVIKEYDEHLPFEIVLEEFASYLLDLGIILVEYQMDTTRFYCLRTAQARPNELGTEEQAVLGTIIQFVESKKERGEGERSEIELNLLENRLVKGKYMSKNALNKYLRELETAGFIQRTRNKVKYGPRTFVELDERSRKEITEQVRKLIP
ncbi:MAG: hypothetical protein ACFFDI_08345 [Promethearchaeota archaeon]